MSGQVLVCGVDCKPGGEHCNGYCRGQAEHPPGAMQEQTLTSSREAAHEALRAATKAWFAYAGLCDVGKERTRAFAVYETLLNACRG